MNNDKTQNTQSLPTADQTPGPTGAAPSNPGPGAAPDSAPSSQPPPADSPTPNQPQPPTDYWDLQPGESQKAFAAFKQYLELGASATLQDIATTAKLSQDSVEHFSRRYHWRERAAAYRQSEARRQAESLHKATDDSNALLAQRAIILRQQQWERAQRLAELADHASDKALKGEEIPPRLDHVARLYNTVDKLADRAVQPLPAALQPTPQDQPISPELEMALNKIYGPIAASGTIPDLKALLDRDRLPAQPATPPVGTSPSRSAPSPGSSPAPAAPQSPQP